MLGMMLVTMDTALENTEISAFMDHAFQSQICSGLET